MAGLRSAQVAYPFRADETWVPGYPILRFFLAKGGRPGHQPPTPGAPGPDFRTWETANPRAGAFNSITAGHPIPLRPTENIRSAARILQRITAIRRNL